MRVVPYIDRRYRQADTDRYGEMKHSARMENIIKKGMQKKRSKIARLSGGSPIARLACREQTDLNPAKAV